MKSYHCPIIVIILLMGICLGSRPANAQAEYPEIKAVIDQLFTGMRSGDSTLVRKSFSTNATLQSISIGADGAVNTQKSAIEGFVKAVGTPHQEVWDERVYDLVIKVDGPLATAWVPYKFYRDNQFSHCGVNAFTLIRLNNEWKIASITDTRRKEQCL